MSLLATKISAFGLLSLAVGLAAIREDESSNPEAGRSGLRDTTSRVVSGGEGPAARGPTKARGLLRDQSYATRMKADGRVIVGGQVNSPGPVSLSRGMTLGSAVTRAGGATPFGSLKRVSLVRGSIRKEYDLTTDSARAILLSDNDTVMIPQKMIIGR